MADILTGILAKSLIGSETSDKLLENELGKAMVTKTVTPTPLPFLVLGHHP
jgi:hypothetical protein